MESGLMQQSGKIFKINVSGPTERILLVLVSSALLVLSFPNPDQGWLAWVALVPLLVACDDLGPAASFPLGLMSGMVAALGIFSWMFAVPGFRWFHGGIAAIYLGLYTAAWCSGVSLAARAGFPLTISAPVLWVTLDFLKSHAGFMALPWAGLAHSQHDNLVVLQVAAITGEHGVTYLLVLVNTALATLVLRRGYRQPLVAGVVLTAVVVYGAFQLFSDEKAEPLRVAAVQPCIWPDEQQKDPGQTNTIRRLEALTAAAAASPARLVVWPETAVLNLQSSPSIRQRLDKLSEKYGAALLVGTSERVKFTDHALDGPAGKGIRSYNSAYLIRSGLPDVEPYRKSRLVPFGEYLPLEGVFHWPSWFVGDGFNTIPGKELTLFRLPGPVTLGVLICWENLFPEIARENVRRGARVLVNMVNDGWFGRTGASRQHNCASILRAVENGVPVIVASNCGPSQVVDARGRVIASLPGAFAAGTVSAGLTVGKHLTFYTRHGNYFAWICVGLSLLAMLYARVRRLST
ncbi:MAG: apolipoprotein N-acyltransferase [Geobacteraceae bacterium]